MYFDYHNFCDINKQQCKQFSDYVRWSKRKPTKTRCFSIVTHQYFINSVREIIWSKTLSILYSFLQAQEKLGFSTGDCDSQPETVNNGGVGGGEAGGPSQGSSLYPPSLVSFPPRTGKSRRNKSPSDLEADDENDHDRYST